MSQQAIEQRFGARSSALLRRVLSEAVSYVVTQEGQAQELLSRFNGVYLQDGTIISLPESLAEPWPGCGGNRPQAGTSSLRVQVRLDLARGGLQGPWLQAGRACERSGEAMSIPLPRGALWNVDMGYFTLPHMRQLDRDGLYWLTHAKATLTITDGKGQAWELLAFLEAHAGQRLDEEVWVGQQRIPMRLIAVRVSEEEAQRRRERANQHAKSQHKGCQAKGPRRGCKGKKRTPREPQA